MNYNAQKYYNGTIVMEDASNLATEIDNALDTLPGMGLFSDFEYKSELKDICNDIFSIRSGCTAICNCIAMGFSNLCSLDTDFNLEYTRISQIEFSKLSEAEQQEYAYIKEYTDKEAMNYLEKNFKDIDFAGLSQEEVETYEFMTGSNVDEIIISKQEYENMSWYEKAGANVSTFGLSVFESLVNLGEGIVDAGIWLTGTAVSNGLVVTIADALVEEDLKGMIKDKMYDAIDYDFSANMYDTIVETSGLNTYVAYGTAHTVGNAVGDYLGYYALSCVPVVGPALCAVAGAGTAIEGNVQNQKANNENGEINDLSVFGSAVGGAFSGYFKGKITKQIVQNGTSIITDLAKNGASGTTATILKSINGKNALNILKNEVKSAGFWFDFGSNAVLSGSEAVVEYNNTGSVDLVKTAKGFAGRFLLDRTLDKVASTDFNEFENPASLMDAARGVKGFVTSGYNSSKKMLGEKITIATNKVKTIGTSVADTVKNAKNNFDLFTINMMNNPKVSKIINDLNDPFYYNVAGGDGIKFFGVHMLKEMLPILANKRAVKNVLDNADFTQKLLKEGMVHFAPSEDVADAIISSKVLKTKRLKMDVLHPFETIKHNAYYVANQGNKTFLFGGIPSYEEMLLNVEIQPKMVGVRIKTDASQLGDIGYRYLDDNALIHSGDLDLSTANSVDKVYVGLKYDKNTNKYFYDELTKEEFDNFEMDISEEVFKKLKSGTTKSKKQIDLMYGSLKQQLDERTHIEVFDLKSEYNKSIDDIRLSSNYEDETARLSDIRKIWEEDLKAVFGEDNVDADDVSDILAKASIVQMGASYQNRNLEKELINDLFGRKETLSSDVISKIEGNDYWIKALNEEQEKFTRYSNGLENWKNSNTPKVLSAEEVKKLQGMSWDEIGKDEKSLRWTYLSQNLGVDVDNIPKSILLTEVKGLDSSIAEDINKTQSYYRKVCIDDLFGSSSKPGSDASGNTFLEKVLFDKGYQGSAKDHMYDDLLESLKREYTDLNLGKEASTGNMTIDLLEHKGKYYIGEDGNHRMVALKVKFMQEMENAKTIEEMAQIREKYTFVLPVKSLDLPIPEIKKLDDFVEEKAFFGKSKEDFIGFIKGNKSKVVLSELSDNQKNIVLQANQILNSGNNCKLTFNSTTEFNSQMLEQIEDLSRVQVQIKSGFNDLNGNYKPKYNQQRYIERMTYSGSEALSITRKLEQLESMIDMNLPPKERAKQIYDILANEYSYMRDYGNYTNGHQVAASLRGLTSNNVVGKEGLVCAGYANAYKELCTRSGINCEYITGKGLSSDLLKSERHAWNVVLVDDEIIPVDVTWHSGSTQSWFGRSEDFAKRHIADIDEIYNDYAPKITQPKVSQDTIPYTPIRYRQNSNESTNIIESAIYAMDAKYGSGQGILSLKRILSTGDYNNMTSSNGARQALKNLSMQEIDNYVQNYNAKIINNSVQAMDMKYGSGKGFEALKRIVDTGDYNFMTSSNGARQSLASLSLNEIDNYLKSFEELELSGVDEIDNISKVIQNISDENVVDFKKGLENLKINLNNKGIEDDLSLARAVYLYTGKEVSYSHLGATDLKNINQKYLENVNKKVICYSWSALYKESLINVGFDTNNIKIIEYGGHHNVCLKANNSYYIADAAYGYENVLVPDMLSIKVGATPTGFFKIPKQLGEDLFNDNITHSTDEYKDYFEMSKLSTSDDDFEKMVSLDEKLEYNHALFNRKAEKLERNLAKKIAQYDIVFTEDEIKNLFISCLNSEQLHSNEIAELFCLLKTGETKIKLATYISNERADLCYSLVSFRLKDGTLKNYLKRDYGVFEEVDNINNKLEELNINKNPWKETGSID